MNAYGPADWIARLHTNQRLLVEELRPRGARVWLIDEALEIVGVALNGRTEHLVDRFSSRTPYASVRITADKHLTKTLLCQNGFPVPEGRLLRSDDHTAARAASREIGFPLVLKPNWGSHGTNVMLDLCSDDEVEAALDVMTARNGSIDAVLERFLPGHEHRVFITERGDMAVLQRRPAFVVGDGISTIERLAELETNRRADHKAKGGASLCPLALDSEVIRHLARRGLSIDTVPTQDETVTLRASSNLAKGGVSIDLTDRVHPAWRDFASRVLSTFPGLPLAGFDLLAEDMAEPPEGQFHALLEVNSNPGFAMHAFPGEGRPQPVAAWAADVLFPYSSR